MRAFFSSVPVRKVYQGGVHTYNTYVGSTIARKNVIHIEKEKKKEFMLAICSSSIMTKLQRNLDLFAIFWVVVDDNTLLTFIHSTDEKYFES